MRNISCTLLLLFNLLHAGATGFPTTLMHQADTTGPADSFMDPGRISRIEAMFPVIQQLYEAHARKNNIPGMAFGIVVDGRLAYTGQYGYTDLTRKIPVGASSVFRIASMSKSFAAMAILQMRDEGKLNLDDPAAKYIPELAKLKYPTADAPPITIRHLLTHGAGFPEDNPWGDRQLADTDKELMALIARQLSFSNPPGIAYEYSNLGFALLGKIITKVSGKPYQQYIREMILLPLGMKHTTYEYGEVPKDLLAHGYRWIYEQWREEELLHDAPDGSWGAMGAMLSSVEDFAAYMSSLAFQRAQYTVPLSGWPRLHVGIRLRLWTALDPRLRRPHLSGSQRRAAGLREPVADHARVWYRGGSIR
jgi:CubicO group peptidase (beta-lactamase class C family)